MVCGSAKLRLQHITVHLDHYAVSVVFEVVTMGLSCWQ